PNITTENDLISTIDGEVYVATKKGYRKISDLTEQQKEDLKSKITDQVLKDFGIEDESISEDKLMDNTIGIEKVNFIKSSTNLLNKNDVIAGKNLNTDTGELINSSVAVVFNKWFELTPGTTYVCQDLYARVFYDENKEIISSLKGCGVFVVPENAKYTRFSTTSVDTAQLNKGSVLKPYNEYFDPYLDEDIGIKKIKDRKTFTLDTSLDLNYTPETIQGCSDDDPLPMGEIQYTDMYDMYDELCNKYPNYVSRKVEGKDILEDEIISYTFKPEEQPFTRNSEDVEKTFKRFKFFIVSSTHGNERTSIWVLYNLMKLICEKWQTNESLEFLRWNVEFVICPIISPSGYRKFTRVNANGVDLNRNFDADWENGSSDKSDTTYRGDVPMSEPEAIVCDNIIKRENPNFVIDFHNFHAQSTPTIFNWIIGYSDKVNDIGDLVLSKMARKWKKQYPDLPQDVVGFGYGSPGIQVGSLSNYAQKKYGIPSSLFEVCWKMEAKTDSIKRDSFISTIGLDTFSNFLLQITNNANEL
ncbi:MAG: succinylglutamate desuccinylase/aspartoacylase family protein, partial [Tetragenococcus koreensis]|nr:succinylglutamate desuccinylase/aspartoacylase family protein [Tetragenococcus koreensis]